MRAVDHVVAEAGKGLIGDRYHGARNRQVTIQSADDLAAAGADFGRVIPASGTRRNITISGPVPALPGTRLTVGEAILEVYRDTPPCRILDEEIAEGVQECLAGRAGVAFRVIVGGEIRVGDAVSPSPSPPTP